MSKQKKQNKQTKQRLTTIKYFYQHTKKIWFTFIGATLGIFLDILTDNFVFIIIKEIIDAIVDESASTETLMNLLILAFIAMLLGWVSTVFSNFCVAHLELKAMKNILDESYKYLLKHSHNFFSNNFTGSLVKKLNKLVDSYETFLDVFIWEIMPVVSQAIISFVILSSIDTRFSIILAFWMLIFIYGNYKFSRYKLKYENKANKIDSKLSGHISDSISNNFNIILFSSLKREHHTLQNLSERWRKGFHKSWSVQNIGEAIQGLFMILFQIAVLYMLIAQWNSGNVTAGDFVLINSVLGKLYSEIWSIGNSIRRIGRVFSDASEMIEILNTPHEITDNKDSKKLKITKGKISINNLTFAYNQNKSIFNNLNLEIKPGERIALVSKSGGGKSTLIKLMLRLHDTPKGSILIDDQDIATVTQESLRSQISLIPQEPVLFHRSLKENIAYGKPNASLDEIIIASKKAQCHEFISSLEKGYDTFVGERGIKLSGGERQRVAIARAILENQPILILDEATSALDSESENLISKALESLMNGKTTIAIAHRLSTIMQMDKIVVLENGVVTESGTHEDLIKSEDSHYKKLWHIQAGGFA